MKRVHVRLARLREQLLVPELLRGPEPWCGRVRMAVPHLGKAKPACGRVLLALPRGNALGSITLWRPRGGFCLIHISPPLHTTLSLSLCFSAPFLLFPCTFFFFSTFIIPHSVLVVSPIPDLFFSSPFVFVIIRTSSFVFVSFASFLFSFFYAPHISLGPSFFFRSYCSLGFVLRFYFCRCCRRRRCCTIRAKIFISAIFVSCFLALRSPS